MAVGSVNEQVFPQRAQENILRPGFLKMLRYNGMNPVFWFSIRLLLAAECAAKFA
jgi:hypothetical protein